MHLGIDLGTSNSAIAGVINSVPRVFNTSDGADYIPSAIYIDKRGNRLYGQRAYSQTFMSPANVATGFKRLMGTSTTFEFEAAGVTMDAEDCSAEVLRQLIGQAHTESGNKEITGTVVTIPAAFNQMQSEATLAAARKAGLHQVALLQEPIAAAMAAMSQSNSKSGQFLVYDLGGGTFDLALVQSLAGTINVLAHEGINMLGGRDFDRTILNSIVRPWLLSEFDIPEDFQRIPKYRRVIQMAAYASEKAKIVLSTATSDVISATEEEVRVLDERGCDIFLQIPLRRSDIEALLKEYIDKTVALTRKVMKEHGYSHDNIDRIVFIGGPTKMPIIREMVPRELGIAADLETNPMTAVALGAAIYCESRDWSTEGSSRKGTRGSVTTKGRLSLRLDFPSRTHSGKSRIKIGCESITALEVYDLEITSRTGWSTGRSRLHDGMAMELPTVDFGENLFHIKVFDQSGRPVDDASETITITRVQASAAGIPATQRISVKVVENNRNSLDPLIEKGTLLPASGTKKFRAARALKQGAHDFIELALYQDDGVPEVELNLCVGSFRIYGEDLLEGMRIQVGDEIIVKWFMSDSGLLEAKLEIPGVGQSFPSPKFYRPGVGHQSFSLDEGSMIALEMLHQAESELNDLVEVIGHDLGGKPDDLCNALVQQRESLENASTGEDTRSVSETVRHVRQEISRIKNAPSNRRQMCAQKLTRMQAFFNEHIRANVSKDVAILFDQHSLNAQKAVARGDERSVREIEAHLEAMEGFQMQYLLTDPRFLISVFQDRLSKRFRATDTPEFDRLARNGKQAIEEEDIDTLRETIFRLDEILMTSGSVEKDIGNLSSLMRG